jgi:hypothetical protein
MTYGFLKESVDDGLMRGYESIFLTRKEIKQCHREALDIENESLRLNRRNNHGASTSPDMGVEYHFTGLLGQKAVSIYLDEPLNPRLLGKFKGEPHIGDDVRAHTRGQHFYGTQIPDLIIREDDQDDFFFVHTTVDVKSALKFPNEIDVRIYGYIKGRNGKRKEYVKSHAGRVSAWFVPKSVLLPTRRLLK